MPEIPTFPDYGLCPCGNTVELDAGGRAQIHYPTKELRGVCNGTGMKLDPIRQGPWICTHKGVAFYPLDPRPEEVLIHDIAHALSQLCRFAGHCHRFYSVAEHSVRVHDAVRTRTAFRNDGTGPGTPGAMLAALLHDASEAYLVDLPRPVKEILPDYKALETRVQQAVWDRFEIDGYDAGFAAIKTCDLILLATERRDLMPATAMKWPGLPNPLSDPIEPWSSQVACDRFLETFYRCQEERTHA